jgi:hypothetical protein
VDEQQSCHSQRSHDRRHILDAEADKKIKRVWNGESALQATMADLLGIWSVAGPGAKYCNPFLGPEVREWHKHLGDFWGPIMLHLKLKKNWMPIEMAFDTGYNHGYWTKTNNENILHWRRFNFEVRPDSPVAIAFKPVLDQIQLAYTRADFNVEVGISNKMDLSSLGFPDSPPLLAEFGPN